MNPILLLLSFLAGAGLDKVIGNVMKVMQPKGSGQNREHRGGVRMDAAQAPGMTIAPQMMQQLQQQGQAQQPDPKLMMLIQKLVGGTTS